MRETIELSKKLRDVYGTILTKRGAWDESFETDQQNDMSLSELEDEMLQKYGTNYQKVKEFYDQTIENLLKFYAGEDVTGDTSYFKYIRNIAG